jgi:hypothetical protein
MSAITDDDIKLFAETITAGIAALEGKAELAPVSIAIDSSSPPQVWGVFEDQCGCRSLWKRPVFGVDPQWQRVEGPQGAEGHQLAAGQQWRSR